MEEKRKHGREAGKGTNARNGHAIDCGHDPSIPKVCDIITGWWKWSG
jgi:hypothetical protein